jgi:hypothetical protein
VRESQLQILIRDRLGLRIEPEMSRYAAGRLAASAGPFPIMGADARTGVAVRHTIDPRTLGDEASSVAASVQAAARQ